MLGGQREPLKLLSGPGPRECAEAVMGALSRRRAVVLFGSCSVSYRGRTSSELAEGERVVFVKEDGSLLVHRSWGYRPVNYMAAGAMIHAREEGGRLVVSARRGQENLRVVFGKVYLLVVLDFRDSSLLEQGGTEAQMREAVLLSPELIEEGFRPLTQEFPVKSGFVDLLGLDRSGRLVAVELKSKRAGSLDVGQLVSYVSRLRALAKGREVRGVLAAPSITRSARRLLAEGGLEYRRLDKELCLRLLEEAKPTKDLLGFLGKQAG